MRRIVGLDVSYGRRGVGAAVIYDLEEDRIIEYAVASVEVSFPYIPGFLAFREVYPMVKALEKLRSSYDVVMVNGQGIAHPRRFGLASHVGVLIRKPTIGVAKKKLCGRIVERGGRKLLIDDGEVIGEILRSGSGGQIVVSQGNMITLESAVRIVKRVLGRHRLPIPLRLAHEIATKHRNL